MYQARKIPFLHSIQTRISAIMIAALVLVLAINLFFMNQINLAVRRIDQVFSSNVSVNTLSDTLELVQDSVYEYLNTRGSKALENYYRYEQDYRSLIGALNDQNTDSELLMLEKNIRCMSESYLEQTDVTVQAKRGRNVEKYRDSYEAQTQLYSYINSYIYRLNTQLFHQNSDNYQLLLSSMNVLEMGSLIVVAFVFFLCILITILLVHDMIRPLTALSLAAHEVAKGRLDLPQLPVVFEDEVGVVTLGFNQMLDGIRENIEKQRESLEKEAMMKERSLLMEAHLKEAQLNYLQSQINPHFLFNSLNAGAQLALLEDAEQTGLFLEKMADFFRYNVRKMGGDATLGEEIESADNYIYILNVRFSGDITYRRDVEDGLSGIRIPSMILQPLVENAVQHGIHDCMETGRILLRVRKRDGCLEILVRDNGLGMTQEKIRSIFDDPPGENPYSGFVSADPSAKKPDSGSAFAPSSAKKTDSGSAGIALRNVVRRLELYYGRKGLIRITSDGIGYGTDVILTLPLPEAAGAESDQTTEKDAGKTPAAEALCR